MNQPPNLLWHSSQVVLTAGSEIQEIYINPYTFHQQKYFPKKQERQTIRIQCKPFDNLKSLQ